MKLRSKKVSVLGCGWLGLPLAASLVKNNHEVHGSTTSWNKLKLLEEKGIAPWLINAGNLPDENEIKSFLSSSQLVITIPPSDKKKYPDQINNIMTMAEKFGTERVIFISSTSVYPSSNKTVDETFDEAPDSDSGRVIKKAEELCLNFRKLSPAVLRFGGLIGPGRDPGRFFSGRTEIPNGRSPVNLIVLDDCIEIIKNLIDKKEVTGIFNAVCDKHPTRAEFYTMAAKVSGLPLPQFRDELNDYKIISNNKLKNKLEYNFIYKNPINWLSGSKKSI